MQKRTRSVAVSEENRRDAGETRPERFRSEKPQSGFSRGLSEGHVSPGWAPALLRSSRQRTLGASPIAREGTEADQARTDNLFIQLVFSLKGNTNTHTNRTNQSFFDNSGTKPHRWQPASDGTKLLHYNMEPFSTVIRDCQPHL